jgi:4-amino-4-deoxy-L-arabinose transferase-like glycosyltransferase
MQRFRNIFFFLIVFAGFGLSFYHLEDRALERWDETTNVQVVRETMQENSFPILTYEQKPFMEKPPIWYYLTILSVKVFGDNNFAFRFISAFSNVLLLVSIIIFCTKKFNWRIAVFSGLTYLSTWQIFINNAGGLFSTHNARSADVDLLQLLFIFLSFVFCIEFQASRRIKYILLIALFSGLAVLTKGFMGLLPVLILILWEAYLIFKQKSISFQSFKLPTLFTFTFLLITLPWHIFMYFQFGQSFINEYFSYHTAARYFSTLEGHNQPLLFHIQNFFNPQVFSSGIIFSLGILTLCFKSKLKEYKYFSLIASSVLSLILITLMQTKLAWYLLYIYPIAVIVCGIFYDYVFMEFRSIVIAKKNIENLKDLHHSKVLINK